MTCSTASRTPRTAWWRIAWSPIPAGMVQLCEIIHRCSRALQKAFEALEKRREGDGALHRDQPAGERGRSSGARAGRRSCSRTRRIAITLIKLKEIYEFLEDTTDHCEDVADVLQNVVVKNS